MEPEQPRGAGLPDERETAREHTAEAFLPEREIDLASVDAGEEGRFLQVWRTYDPRRFREYTRGAVAILLILLLAGTIIWTFVLVGGDNRLEVSEAQDLLAVLLSPLVGLVGAATGFYYGGKD